MIAKRLTLKLRLRNYLAQSSVSRRTLGNNPVFLHSSSDRNREKLALELRGSLDLFRARVSLLRLVGPLGEHNQLALVLLQSLNVQHKALLGAVLAAVVDGDTNGPGLLLADSGSLQLLQRETTASTELGVVFDGLTADGRAQQAVNGAGSNAGSLLGANRSPALLLSGL